MNNTPRETPSYEIYHATDIMAMLHPDPQAWLANRDRHYQHVANIQTQLEWVFFMTQHTDGRNWTKHPEVSWVTPNASPRSTSVGDVIYSPETHQAWLIGHADLEEIVSLD